MFNKTFATENKFLIDIKIIRSFQILFKHWLKSTVFALRKDFLELKLKVKLNNF